MKSAIFLSARMKSTRLPKKQMEPVCGRPITAHLIDRLKTARKADLIVMATSTHPDDRVLLDLAKQEGIESFAGSPPDRLDRYWKAAQHFGVDFMAIVDGDDPFCDPEYIDRTLALRESEGAQFIYTKGLPLGGTSIGLETKALAQICEQKDEEEPELWVSYFTETGLFKVLYPQADAEVRRPEIRMTLDYPEDLAFFKAIFEKLYKPRQVFSLRQILALLDAHPEIVALNSSCAEKYEANLKRIRRAPQLKSAKPS